MTIRRRDVLKAVGGFAGALATTKQASAGHRTLRRDVCVVGGGSAGCYTAVRLRDQGASVALIERKSRLGGHAETYVDPSSGAPINIGVVVFEGTDLVKNYTQRFGLTLAPFGSVDNPTSFIDFRTGLPVSYAPPDPVQFFTALLTYRAIIAQNYPYLDDGFTLPDPVPAELARPFSEFVERYGLQALFPLAFQFSQGAGDMLGRPALYGLKLFSAAVVDSLISGMFLTPPGGVTALYDNIATHLGDDALLDTEVTDVEYGRKRIRVTANSGCGSVDIVCNRLVIACPPVPQALSSLGVDSQTRNLFGRLKTTHYSTGVVQLSGLPAGLTLQNVGADTPYNLPALPGVYAFNPSMAPGLWNVKVGAAGAFDTGSAKELVLKTLKRISQAGTHPVRFEGFRVFTAHAPFQLGVDGSDIASGFYAKVNAVQGRNNTFFTGAALQTNDSSLIWRFSESLLPRILG